MVLSSHEGLVGVPRLRGTVMSSLGLSTPQETRRRRPCSSSTQSVNGSVSCIHKLFCTLHTTIVCVFAHYPETVKSPLSSIHTSFYSSIHISSCNHPSVNYPSIHNHPPIHVSILRFSNHPSIIHPSIHHPSINNPSIMWSVHNNCLRSQCFTFI